MARADARVGSLSLRGTVGTTVNLTLTWPADTSLGTVVVSVGDDDYPATVNGNVAVVALDVPGQRSPLTVTVDDELKMTGSFTVSQHGTDTPNADVTVVVDSVNVDVAAYGTAGTASTLNLAALYEES